MSIFRSVITGTGCFIPGFVKNNLDFTVHHFYDENSQRITTSALEVVNKFKDITGIAERRYADVEMNSSDMATLAAIEAIKNSGIDPEELDQIIVAHNFGNVIKHTIQTDVLPALASRVKQALGIKKASCIAHDILFGCPGWIQGMIHADAFFKAGIASKALVIGTETLSRVLDDYDRDSMIFSDGAGACVLEYKEVEPQGAGILAATVASHCVDEAYYLYMGKSNFPGSDPRIRYIKMKGRKVYEYAMQYVPQAMKECLDKSGVQIKDLKKVFIHQANEKMDEGIIKRLYKLYGESVVPENIMPMSIHELGNSSVATVPTLFHNVLTGKLADHNLQPGDVVMFASVGAGMNINAVCYRM
ncbi:MAG TPA: ketoacyl-ACP synthase III [Phnomibacter sp.]|nr:ketoacyl-ACP synthase III [Phnomibacter sp.]